MARVGQSSHAETSGSAGHRYTRPARFGESAVWVSGGTDLSPRRLPGSDRWSGFISRGPTREHYLGLALSVRYGLRGSFFACPGICLLVRQSLRSKTKLVLSTGAS